MNDSAPRAQDKMLNRLLHGHGSIADRVAMIRELDDDHLQIAAARSPEAKIELERRLSERAGRTKSVLFWQHPITRTILSVIGVVAAAAIIFFFGLK